MLNESRLNIKINVRSPHLKLFESEISVSMILLIVMTKYLIKKKIEEGRVPFDSQFEAAAHSRKGRMAVQSKGREQRRLMLIWLSAFVQPQTSASGSVQPNSGLGLLTLINSI